LVPNDAGTLCVERRILVTTFREFVAEFVRWDTEWQRRYETVLGPTLARQYRLSGRLDWRSLFEEQEVDPGKDDIRNFLPFITDYTYTDVRGERFRVIWGQIDEANRLNGVCMMISEDGQDFVEAEFEDGQMNGWHRWVETDGTQTVAWKKDGQTNGYSWRQEPDGSIYESLYRNGNLIYPDDQVPSDEEDYFIEKVKISRVREQYVLPW